MRVPIHARGLLVCTGTILLFFASTLARADDTSSDARAADAGRFGIAASVQYVFQSTEDTPVIPVVSMGNRPSPLSTPPTDRPLSFRYNLAVAASAMPESRVELAKSLLLPGTVGLTLGAAHGWSNESGTRILVPEVSVGAKVVPWRTDTTAVKVGISGGLGFAANQVFGASIVLTRAVNAVGNRNQKRLLAASDSPDLWASDVAATAAIQSKKRALGLFGEFGAYLFDSKFHVPVDGRRVFTLGVRKAFS